MRQFLLLIAFLSCCPQALYAQKMLLLEQTGKLSNVRFYVGQTLNFRLVGKENYWYARKITDVLAESNTVVLGTQLVAVEDISAIKVVRKGRWKRFSAKLVIFGVQLAFATGQAVADKRWGYSPLFVLSAAATSYGTFMLTDKKIKLGKRKRLLATEIRFSATQEIAPPPSN